MEAKVRDELNALSAAVDALENCVIELDRRIRKLEEKRSPYLVDFMREDD